MYVCMFVYKKQLFKDIKLKIEWCFIVEMDPLCLDFVSDLFTKYISLCPFFNWSHFVIESPIK